MTAILIPLYLLLIFTVPTVVSVAPVLLVSGVWAKLLCVALGPLVYGMTFVLTAGVLSLRHQHAIRPGRFPRRLDDPVYGQRRLYGLCWTSVYYFKPLYFVFLSVPVLKAMLFRLFGYQGQLDFTIYPDTWIRDLPLLSFGKGAYIANRATLATNIVLGNGTLLVNRVHVGSGALVGHLAMLAPGFVIGDNSEVGVGTALGMETKLGNNVKVGPVSGVDNGAVLEDGVRVGTWAYVGARATVKTNVSVRSGNTVKARSLIGDSDGAKQSLALSGMEARNADS